MVLTVVMVNLKHEKEKVSKHFFFAFFCDNFVMGSNRPLDQKQREEVTNEMYCFLNKSAIYYHWYKLQV